MVLVETDPVDEFGAALAPGDHIALLYETDEESRAAVSTFVREGIEAGDKVLYLSDAGSEEVLRLLGGEGLNTGAGLMSGQLDIRSAEDSYVGGGSFEPDRMVAFLRAQAGEASRKGYRALRIVGDMSWALRGVPGSERVLEYERKLDDFLTEVRALALCHYDRRGFDQETILGATALHPRVIAEGVSAPSFARRELEIEETETPGRFRLGGVVDVSNVNLLSRAMEEATRRGTDLDLDLSGLTFVDVAGLWVLYDAAVRLGRDGKRVNLFSPPPPVEKVLQILGWHELASLRIVETRV